MDWTWYGRLLGRGDTDVLVWLPANLCSSQIPSRLPNCWALGQVKTTDNSSLDRVEMGAWGPCVLGKKPGIIPAPTKQGRRQHTAFLNEFRVSNI